MRKLIDIIQNRTANQTMIIVTGPYNSGKTQFLSTFNGKDAEEVNIGFCTREERTDKDGNRQIMWDDVSEQIAILPLPDAGCLYLLEWRGARRIDKLVNTAGDFIRDWIIVVDASQPQTFREAKSILETFRAYPEFVTPVIAANRPDAPGAWTMEDLRTALRLEELRLMLRMDKLIPLIPCDAADRRSTMDVVAKLAEHIPDTDFATLLRQHLNP
jgi:uncharacterized protein